MTFIPVPRAIKVALEFTLGGQLVVLTIGLAKSTDITPTDLTTAANATSGWVQTSLLPLLSNNLAFTGATAYDLSAVDAPIKHVTVSPAATGGVNAPSQPSNAALVASLRTNARGRGARGRNYIPALPPGAILSPTSTTAAFAAGVGAAYAQLISNFESISMPVSIISRWLNKTQRVEGITRPVTAVITNQDIDSQRRRLNARGV